MFKFIADEVWVFDAEWAPDIATGRRVYAMAEDASEDAVLQRMWQEGGADEKTPRPYLKTILCRVISIAAVIRSRKEGVVTLQLRALPDPPNAAMGEADLIKRFLGRLGRDEPPRTDRTRREGSPPPPPQLVGFNSLESDLMILKQRALALGLSLPGFCHRPNKPWEGADFFARGSDYNIDLKEIFGGWGKRSLSLHEMATASGIPGKIGGVDGQSVVDLWHAGDIRRIVQYNECDAITTYLLWLRAAHLGGHLSHEAFVAEEQQLQSLLEGRAAQGGEHLAQYLQIWQRWRASR